MEVMLLKSAQKQEKWKFWVKNMKSQKSIIIAFHVAKNG
ncbi:hypothetical protein CHUV0807_1143 [Cardiobacterium hominis]|uniref:Uncharacterized protein n=1 Tax=Cardiobacterium hominis TaxID=2718 RepID=A0A1C3H453_9GAMM|nr:hypothetical protein CHUV0807_1143 [Cardiobacterium hominis]